MRRMLLMMGALALAVSVAVGAQAPLATARVFLERMKASGRAEAEFERIVRIAGAQAPEPVRGTLALEAPGLARIEFPSTGECITLRSDGGEWLQPQLEQLLTLEAAHAANARRWWSMLSGTGTERFGERKLDAKRWLVWTIEPDAESDTARVTLDSAGLPSAIRVRETSGLEAEYRFRAWRFAKPRGERAFHLTPAPGMRVVPMP